MFLSPQWWLILRRVRGRLKYLGPRRMTESQAISWSLDAQGWPNRPHVKAKRMYRYDQPRRRWTHVDWFVPERG